ncbi:MAG: SGNH/GDSL hydrolase family protein [Myxococcota bacterium]
MRIKPFPGLEYDMLECKECLIRINSFGLRGEEIKIPKPENTIRVLIIGDSATFGAGVINNDETIPGRLQRLMDENPPIKGKRIEIINGGIPGYDIQEIYLHYKYKLKQLNSDIVIYNFFPNDFLNSKFSVENINGKPMLVRYVNAELPGLQFLQFLPESINIFLNEHLLLYRYSMFYISRLFSNENAEAQSYLKRYQIANLEFLNKLIDEIKSANSIFMVSSEIYSFCGNCKEPLDNNRCPIEKGCIYAFNLIKWLNSEMNNRGIPSVYLSDVVSDMDLREVMIDEYAHYTGKANIMMAEKLYKFLLNSKILEK